MVNALVNAGRNLVAVKYILTLAHVHVGEKNKMDEERTFSMSMYLSEEALYKDKAKYYQELYKEAQEEIKKLKRQLREAKDKLYDKNRAINQMRDEDFNRVDFGRE